MSFGILSVASVEDESTHSVDLCNSRRDLLWCRIGIPRLLPCPSPWPYVSQLVEESPIEERPSDSDSRRDLIPAHADREGSPSYALLSCSQQLLLAQLRHRSPLHDDHDRMCDLARQCVTPCYVGIDYLIVVVVRDALECVRDRLADVVPVALARPSRLRLHPRV